MSAEGYIGEIREQPQVLRALARAFEPDHAAELARVRRDLASGTIAKVVMTGMGGSLHSLYPAYLALSQACPIPTLLWDCSELVQQAPEVIDDRTLVIAVSQSGESGELVRLCRSVARPQTAIAITNSGENTLARWADISVRTLAGPERTASTKTYTAGLAGLALVTGALLGHDLSTQAAHISAAAEMIERHLPAWQAMSADLASFLGSDAPIAFVGRGVNLATAHMSALLTNEASKLSSTAFSGGQFRHGPIELVREGFSCVIFASADHSTGALDRRTADTVVELGGRCAWIGASRARAIPRPREFTVGLPDCDSTCLPILNMIPVQLLQVPLALARGLVPAQFVNASKVTTIE